jgi:RecA-family ATPase
MDDKTWFENNQPSVPMSPEESVISEYDKGQAILQKSKSGYLTWNEMMGLPNEENNYLIDKFLWEGQVAMILAKEKVGKSILSKQMICALTSGESLFDEYDVAKKCTVCYIQLEGDRGETKSRFKSMSRGVGVGEDNFFWRFYDRLQLDKDADANTFIQEMVEARICPDVIFLDPVYMACSGSLSNDEVVRNMIGNIRRIQDVFNCAIVLVHHEHRGKKDQNGRDIDEGDNAIMGSFAFKAFVSHVMRITKKPDGTRVLKCDTQRNGGVESEVKLTLHENPLMYKKQIGPVPKGLGETIYGYIRSKKDGASAVDFIEAHHSNASSVGRAITSLKQNGHIRKNGKKGKGQIVWVITKKGGKF